MPNPSDWPTQTEGVPIVPPDPPSQPLISERERRLDQALRHILQWAATYPEPDEHRAAVQHALKGVSTIAQTALDAQ